MFIQPHATLMYRELDSWQLPTYQDLTEYQEHRQLVLKILNRTKLNYTDRHAQFPDFLRSHNLLSTEHLHTPETTLAMATRYCHINSVLTQFENVLQQNVLEV